MRRSLRRRRAATVVTERSDLDRDVVALTFDDGPAEWTEPILDSLGRAGVRATFFVIGDAIPGREATLARAQDVGHEIGNHTLSHRRLDSLDRDQVRDELNATSRRIADAIGLEPRVFRPPYFAYDRAVLEAAVACGYDRVVNASVFTNDFAMTSAREIADDFLASTRRGSIIDLHDGRPPHDRPHSEGKSRDDRWPTVEAVESIVSSLLERGFGFVTVSELLAL